METRRKEGIRCERPVPLLEEYGAQVFILPLAFISGVMFGITCTLKVLHML